MSLKSKIEAVIYASEEPVTLAQLVVLLSEEAQSELDALAALQSELPLADAAVPPFEDGLNQPATETPPADTADPVGAPETPPSEAGTHDELAASNSGATIAGPESLQVQNTSQGVTYPGDPSAAAEMGAPTSEVEKRRARERDRAVREYLRGIVDTLIREYADSDRGLEIREVAGGFRFGTKPEYHDAVRGFVKSLKPALKLSLQALETLAVVAYKQPVTAAEISEIRGVDSAGVLGGLLTRKLIQTAGRKQVIGRPMLYKTTREFLVRFGLRDVQELPSMEEFERMAGELAEQEDLPMEATEHVIERTNARGDAEHIRQTNEATPPQPPTASPAEEAGPQSDSTGGDPSGGDDPHGNAAQTPSGDAQSSPRSEAEPPTSSEDPA